MFRYFTIYIFLSVTALGINAQSLFAKADSLYKEQNYALAQAEYERIVFLSSNKDTVNKALRQKCRCQKQTGSFLQAALTSERFASEYEDYFEKSLCYYLASDFEKANLSALKCELIFDSLAKDVLLVQVLALNEMNLYDSAKSRTVRLASLTDTLTVDNVQSVIDSLYSHKPKLLNEKTGRVLAFVPGAAQVYAGQYTQAVTSLLLNAVAAAFGVSQILDKCYITAYLFGAGGLSITYPGGVKNGNYCVQKANYKKTSAFNALFKERLIEMMSNISE